MTFKELAIGDQFFFASEFTPGDEGEKGPWIKVSARQYHKNRTGRLPERIEVPSVNTKVVKHES